LIESTKQTCNKLFIDEFDDKTVDLNDRIAFKSTKTKRDFYLFIILSFEMNIPLDEKFSSSNKI
jgi:hypothetical protein